MPAEQETPVETSPSGEAPSRVAVRAYSLLMRLLVVALQAIAGLNILYIAVHLIEDVLYGEQSAPPLVVALGVSVFSGVPMIAAALLRWLCSATIELHAPLLVLTLRRARFEIPLASIAALRPFWLPLPGPGLALKMTSGRLFGYRLELSAPDSAMARVLGELPAGEEVLKRPSILYALAKGPYLHRRGYYWLLKFGLFPLGLALILFRLHQYIVYGGVLGQYYLLGLAAYLKTLGAFVAGTAGQLIVYAGAVRIFAEALTLLLTFVLPAHARAVRRATEILCQVAYFGLVSAYVLIRLLL